MKELDDDLHAQIVSLSELGDALADDERYAEAVAEYQRALALLPDPMTDWEAGTWLLTAIGDAWFLAGDYEAAREALRQVMFCPSAIGNPFVHLRRGQVFFELGDLKGAQEELAGAYMIEGRDIFEGEDAKYFEYLKTVLRPPASGKW